MGGAISTNAGALLLRHCDRVIGLFDRVASCFIDCRTPELVVHELPTPVGQRICGIALGYEDLNDHDQLRHDPVLALLSDRLEAKRKDCAVLSGKSTWGRLKHAPSGAPGRYHRIGHDGEAMERLFVDLYLDAHAAAPSRIVLDLDATDDPVQGTQEGRFHHGYYKSYCQLPLYITCGRHLLAAKLRAANIDGAAGALEEVARIVAQICKRWPRVGILSRTDAGFARKDMMAWCEANGIGFLCGLAQNARLRKRVAREAAAQAAHTRTGRVARRFADFSSSTRKSWSRARRVVGKAEHLARGANPRFVVTSLGPDAPTPGGSTNGSTAPGARWRTGSRGASLTSSPTAPRRRRCGPTNSGSGSPRSPTSWSTACAASRFPARRLPRPRRVRSASSC